MRIPYEIKGQFLFTERKTVPNEVISTKIPVVALKFIRWTKICRMSRLRKKGKIKIALATLNNKSNHSAANLNLI